MVNIKVFKPGEDASDVYAFRYQIYEQEMHRNDHYSDHEKRMIVDPLDSFGYNIIAVENANIIGAVRVNFCADGRSNFYEEFYELKEVGTDFPEKVSFSTRLMVHPTKRCGLLPLMLSAECFRLALARNTRWSYCDCNPPFIPFFERLFFSVVNDGKVHPSFGRVAVMRIDLEDERIYDRKQSMIARYLD